MKITIEGDALEIRELLSGNRIQDSVRAIPEATTKEIRAWARSQGMAVAKGGTLPRDVVEAYYFERQKELA